MKNIIKNIKAKAFPLFVLFLLTLAGFVAVINLYHGTVVGDTISFDKPSTYISTAKAGAPCIVKNPDTGNYLLFSTTNSGTRSIHKCWSDDINTTTWYDSTSLFNDGSTWCHCILKHSNGTAAKVNGDYWMFYSGGNGEYIRAANPSTKGNLNSSSWSYNSTIGTIVARSDESWHDGNQIGKLGVTALLDDDGTVIVMYEGNDAGSTTEGIGIVTSDDDCDSWTINSNNPVFVDAGSGSYWDGESIDYPSLTKYDDTYVMIYCGQNQSPPYVRDSGWTVEMGGIATSTDLENWTRYSENPIIYPPNCGLDDNWGGSGNYASGGEWDEDGNSDFSHLFIENKMYLFYEGENTGHVYHIGFAWFDDFLIDLGVQEAETVIGFVSIENGVNNSYMFNSTPTIIWDSIDNTSRYWLQIDDDADFSSPVVDLNDINLSNYPSHYVDSGTEVTFMLPVANKLPDYDTYYWRVRNIYYVGE